MHETPCNDLPIVVKFFLNVYIYYGGGGLIREITVCDSAKRHYFSSSLSKTKATICSEEKFHRS